MSTTQYQFWNSAQTSQYMTILSSGNVGIGTASPGYTLTSAGTICGPYSSIPLLACYAQGSGNFTYANVISCAYINSKDSTQIFTPGNGGNGGAPVMTLQAGNFVGIGTASPGTALQVNGTVTANTFSGSGASLTGTASSLNVNYATTAGSAPANGGTATSVSGGSVSATTGYFSGKVGIGTSVPDYSLHVYGTANLGVNSIFTNYTNACCLILNGDVNAGWSAVGAVLYASRLTYSNRSINASGTINASGADYAEYMTKAGDFTIKKGDVVGVNAQGLLTNVFTEAVTFVVKSTDPSYVGGDVWGTEETLGATKPTEVKEDDPGYAEYKTALDQFNAKLEEARVRVDRIAFAGQVPVNVLGATPGQYIVPVANEDGSISGQAVSSPTFEQYMATVGKVINVLPDGRAQIIVKVV